MPIKIIIEFSKCSSKSIISGFRDYLLKKTKNYTTFGDKWCFA